MLRPNSGGLKDFVPDDDWSPPVDEPEPTYVWAHEFCDTCDALLLPAEWCPCSRLWARAAEVAHSWAPVFEVRPEAAIAA